MENPPISIKSSKNKPFRLTFLDVQIPDLPAEFDEYRIVQLTDLHLGPCTPADHIKQAIDITLELKPHLVTLTGDYVQCSGTGLWHTLAYKVHPHFFRWAEYRRVVRNLAKKLSAMLSRLNPPDGIIGVFGNHDYQEGIGTIKRQLPHSIKWLVNESLTITKGQSMIRIAGVDDYKQGNPDLKSALDFSANSNTVYRILLAHNPDVTLLKDNALLEKVNLMLAGHTHGGQICLPGSIPVITRTSQRKHYNGFSVHDSTNVYVSPGIGCGGLPFRLFCPPEITVITLQRQP